MILLDEKSPVSLYVNSKLCEVLTLNKNEFNNIIVTYKDKLQDSLHASNNNIEIIKEIIDIKTEKCKTSLNKHIESNKSFEFDYDNEPIKEEKDENIFTLNSDDLTKTSNSNTVNNTITSKLAFDINNNHQKIIKMINMKSNKKLNKSDVISDLAEIIAFLKETLKNEDNEYHRKRYKKAYSYNYYSHKNKIIKKIVKKQRSKGHSNKTINKTNDFKIEKIDDFVIVSNEKNSNSCNYINDMTKNENNKQANDDVIYSKGNSFNKLN